MTTKPKTQPHPLEMMEIGETLFGIAGIIEAEKHEDFSGHFRKLHSDKDTRISGSLTDPYLGKMHSVMLSGKLEYPTLAFEVHLKDRTVRYEFKYEFIGGIYICQGTASRYVKNQERRHLDTRHDVTAVLSPVVKRKP